MKTEDSQPPRPSHNHVEAFCVMTYRCERCGQRERIWNSRDGVTPFTVGCRACNGPASHIEWKRDEYRPDYTPRPGERIFRDGTPDEAREFMRQRIAKCKGTPYELSAADAAEVVERAAMATDGEFQPGWPNLAEAQSIRNTPPEDQPGKSSSSNDLRVGLTSSPPQEAREAELAEESRNVGELLQAVCARTSERDQARAAMEMIDAAYCEAMAALDQVTKEMDLFEKKAHDWNAEADRYLAARDEWQVRAEQAEATLTARDTALRALPRYTEAEVRRYPSTYEWVNADELDNLLR